MSSSWWKRLFNLDDDDEEWSDNKTRPNSGEKAGRLEDPHRHVNIRMLHKYPETEKNERFEPSKGQINNKKRESHSVYRNQTRAKEENRSRPYYKEPIPKEEKLEVKKPPFKRTEVPSPVYGFRKPPSRRHEQPPVEKPADKIPTHEWEQTKDRDLRPSEQIEQSKQYDEQEKVSIADKKNETPVALEQEKAVESSRAYPSVPPYKAQRRSSKVPYNVLMFRSDKSALQSQKGDRVEDVATQKGHEDAKTFDQKDSEIQKVLVKNPEVKEVSKTINVSSQLSTDLLDAPPTGLQDDHGWIDDKRRILEQTLNNFHVKAEMVGHVQGPAVTRFEIRLHPGVKVNKVINLTEDIKLSMAAKQIRIAPVPGKNTVGIEVPNDIRKPVYLKDLLDSAEFNDHSSPLAAVLGQDVSGQNTVTDLSKMPHGLIAGATGSGKSVCIHSLILSLIYKASPDMLRLILIDPKVVELAAYQKLPHLAAPVITQPKEASSALKWAVAEMERRYQVFAKAGVRDISRYNTSISREDMTDEKMPYIVIIIDELADLMMVAPQDVEEAICRIAQKARAAGIHLLLATQRPSVDVITGLIKSNIPTRIAFSVSSQVDSRTIIDTGGAERLLGQGDMLFVENGAPDVKRLQGCFVSDEEIDRITSALEKMEAPPFLFDKEEILQGKHDAVDDEDDLFEEAGCFVIEQGHASVSSLQRKFRIGYNRAARLVDQLEALNVISKANGSKPRQILMARENFDEHVLGHEVY